MIWTIAQLNPEFWYPGWLLEGWSDIWNTMWPPLLGFKTTSQNTVGTVFNTRGKNSILLWCPGKVLESWKDKIRERKKVFCGFLVTILIFEMKCSLFVWLCGGKYVSSFSSTILHFYLCFTDSSSLSKTSREDDQGYSFCDKNKNRVLIIKLFEVMFTLSAAWLHFQHANSIQGIFTLLLLSALKKFLPIFK